MGSSRSLKAKRLLGTALGRPLAGPRTVSLEVTHNCNLRCGFCESHGMFQSKPITEIRPYVGGRRTMDLDTIRRLVDDLARIGTDLVELSGKGDPIAHPELTEIVRIIKDAGIDCALVTNATIPRKDLAATLVERGLNRLSVSLNAGSREVYLKTCGRDLWDKAIGFLREVIELRRAAGAQRPWVQITNVLCTLNAKDVEEMARVICELGVDQTEWLVMGELPTTTHIQLSDEDATYVLDRLPLLGRRLEKQGIPHNFEELAVELRMRHRAGRVMDNPLQRKIPCYDPWMFVVIQPDGVVVPCCFCEEVKLGNVFEESFSSIWFGAKYVALRRQSLDMPKTGKSICAECFTTCNRAGENLRIHNRTRLFGKVQAAVPIPQEDPATQ